MRKVTQKIRDDLISSVSHSVRHSYYRSSVKDSGLGDIAPANANKNMNELRKPLLYVPMMKETRAAH